MSHNVVKNIFFHKSTTFKCPARAPTGLNVNAVFGLRTLYVLQNVYTKLEFAS